MRNHQKDFVHAMLTFKCMWVCSVMQVFQELYYTPIEVNDTYANANENEM